MIFIDSNVPMYLVGAHHPNKIRALQLLGELIRNGERLVTDIEVYQEILHRYTSIRRTDSIDGAFRSLDGIVDEVFGYGMPEIRAARTIIDSLVGVSAGDALHVAVMRSNRVDRILSFDRGFDAIPGVERLQ